MFDEPYAMIIGWTLDDIGPVICDYLRTDYDDNWRDPDSKSTWHIELMNWDKNPLDLFISYGLDDDYSSDPEGRYLIGVHLSFELQDLTDAVHRLQGFLDLTKKEGIDLPGEEYFFYSGDAAYGRVGDGNGDDYVFERNQ